MSQTDNNQNSSTDADAKKSAVKKKSNLWQVFQSVMAAFFGVQTRAKFDHDAGQGDYKSYLIVGALMTLLFVVSLAYFVKWLVGDITAGL